tara:strand:+ start:2162 stop:2413 length:252 start_codon:yes stop_codon:yes gene_type:complete
MVSNSSKIGRLVSLREGWYFRSKDALDNPDKPKNIHYRQHIKEGTKALLLEYQGNQGDRVCWTAYINGEVIIVWEDDISENGS